MVVVACKIIVSAPVPFLFLWTLDFNFLDLNLWLGFGTWIWDLELDLGLTKIIYIFTQFLIFIVVWESNPIYFLWLSVLQTNIWDSIIRRGQWDRFLRSHALQFMKFLVACCDKLASASLLDLFSSCHIATPSWGHLSRQLMTDSLEQKSFVPRIILRYGMWQMKEMLLIPLSSSEILQWSRKIYFQ